MSPAFPVRHRIVHLHIAPQFGVLDTLSDSEESTLIDGSALFISEMRRYGIPTIHMAHAAELYTRPNGKKGKYTKAPDFYKNRRRWPMASPSERRNLVFKKRLELASFPQQDENVIVYRDPDLFKNEKLVSLLGAFKTEALILTGGEAGTTVLKTLISAPQQGYPDIWCIHDLMLASSRHFSQACRMLVEREYTNFDLRRCVTSSELLDHFKGTIPPLAWAQPKHLLDLPKKKEANVVSLLSLSETRIGTPQMGSFTTHHL